MMILPPQAAWRTQHRHRQWHEQQLSLVTGGSASYYTNSLGQKFNINLLRYYISAIELETTDGKSVQSMYSEVSARHKGYYLIDDAFNPASQVVELDNIPAGKYSKITFTVGVDSTGQYSMVLHRWRTWPATSKMFWNWNSGYIAPQIWRSGLMLPTAVWVVQKPSLLPIQMASLSHGRLEKHCVQQQQQKNQFQLWHRCCCGCKNLRPRTHDLWCNGFIQWSPQSWFHRQLQCAQTIRWGGHGTQHEEAFNFWPYSSVIVFIGIGRMGKPACPYIFIMKSGSFSCPSFWPYGMRTGQPRYENLFPSCLPIFRTRSIRLTNFRWPRLVSTR